MFLTLLSPFLGILGSLLPSIVRIFELKVNQQYQLEMMKMQMEAAVQNAQVQIAIQDSKADVADSESVRSYDNNVDGGRFINALRTSIRPVITYSFFFLFVAVKVAAAYVMIKTGQDIPTMLAAVWDQDTMALFGTIIAFWFGSRVLEKMGYGGMTYGSVKLVPMFDKKK